MEAIKAMKDVFRFNRYVLKPYLINDGIKHPFAIICPGGAYNMICSRKEGEPYAKELNKRGYHAFVLYYGIKRKARYPRPQEDLKRAITEIFANEEEWNLITNNWSIWGSSAGGHLAASYCLEDFGTPLPNVLVLCYPVITLGEHTHKKTHDNLLGKKPTIEMVDKMSIEKHISSSFPKEGAYSRP